MTHKTRKAGAPTPANLKNSLPTKKSMPDSGKAGQDLPRLSSLVTAEDREIGEYWKAELLAEEAYPAFARRVQNEFETESKRMAETADEFDLEVLTRAFRRCHETHDQDAALPGRFLASILIEMGIEDLGTGRHENTRRKLAMINASKRLKAAGVAFVDDSKEEPLNASEGR